MRTHALKAGAKKARLRLRRRSAQDRSAANDSESAALQAFEEEEPLEFLSDQDASSQALSLIDPLPDPANEALAIIDDEPPFDPPDGADILGLREEFEDDILESDAPFDAPDDIEESFGISYVTSPRELPTIELVELAAPAPVASPPVANARLAPKPASQARADIPTPPIVVQANWDRAETSAVFAALADDKRLARAQLSIERGGADGALAAMERGARPDLVIIDSNLSGLVLVESVDRLRGALGPGAKLIVIGVANDISVLRALNARGIGAYLMAPVSAEELTQTVCGLFAENDRSRVIAVMGARGGVGASTIASNMAWTIAERLDGPVTLVDLDIGFGAAAAAFQLEPQFYVTDLLAENVNEEDINRALTRAHNRLLVAAAPGAPGLGVTLESAAVEAMIARVRRTGAYVVLDVPHVWTAWVRDVLIKADEVLLVASPDLASLRNADNLMKMLRQERGVRAEPALALTMTGVPKRPEISLKDFSESIGVGPVATFAFEPDVYGEAEHNGRVLCDAAPKSKAAQAIEALACGFTGRTVVERKAQPKRDVVGAPLRSPETPLELQPHDDVQADAVAFVTAPVQESSAPSALKPQPATPPSMHVEDDGLSEFERTYLEKARRKALAAIENKRKTKRAMPASRTMVRFIGVGAAAYALGWVTLWSAERQQTSVAQAAPVANVSMPAAPADPLAIMQANYTQALAMLAQQDPRGVSLLTQTAEAGFPLAQYRLAKLYESGEGVDPNAVNALQWIERAAANGNLHAMHDLGFYYARGEAVRRDETAALLWFRQAAEFGFADSQYNLGVLYLQGRGVSADMGEALFWFTLAAEQGDLAAQQRLVDLGADLSAVHVEQARARADGFEQRTPNALANGN